VVDGEVTKIRVVPKPYQQLHPPLWTMAGSDRTAKLAADREYNAMAIGTNPELLSKMVDTYAEARSERGGRQFVKGEGWALLRPVHVAPTMEQACSNFEESAI
jgi:alkanesulfonate monooxygenase SsuD/methylene tetrahydromethanopterin reductase-like flavin-dependent oxidoreductase (luciferase family)